MKHASYCDATSADTIPSVTASLVADIFGVATDRVTADLMRRKRHFDRVRGRVRRDLAKGERDNA